LRQVKKLRNDSDRELREEKFENQGGESPGNRLSKKRFIGRRYEKRG